MSLASLIVRIGADTADLDRGLTRANRNVEQFGRKIRPLGNSLARIGNSASMAAGSLSRLGGVMPGVVGGMGRVVGTLGTAGVVLGETTILTAGLTKSMRLLQAASLAVAASSAPAWLASLATPAGIAVAAVAALAAAVWGLKTAWDTATGPGKRFKKVIEAFTTDVGQVGDVASLRSLSARLQSDFDRLSAARTAELGKKALITEGKSGLVTIRGGPDFGKIRDIERAQKQIAEMMRIVGVRFREIMPTIFEEANFLAEATIEEWRQAVDGTRPLTDELVERWDDASQKIGAALHEATKKVGAEARTQANKLLALKAKLEDVFPRTPDAPTIDIKGLLHRDMPQQMIGRGLDPRRFLGDKMDFRPTPMAPSPRAKPDIGATLDQMAQSGAGASGRLVAEMMQGIAMFGPLGAAMPVVTAAFEALAPVLEPLIPIVEILGQMLATGLTPAIRFITIGLSFLAEALGWVIRGIGRLVDALPGVSAKGVINTGQAMIDAARSARKNALANDYATKKVNEFAGALSNIPRVFNVNALRHLISGSSRPTTGPGGAGKGGSGGTGGPGQPMMSVGTVNIHINGATDPERTAEAVGRALDLRVRRGGTSRLAVALA